MGAVRWGGRFDKSWQQRRKRKTHFMGSPLTRSFTSLPPASAPWSRSHERSSARPATRTTAIEKLNASTECSGPYCHTHLQRIVGGTVARSRMRPSHPMLGSCARAVPPFAPRGHLCHHKIASRPKAPSWQFFSVVAAALPGRCRVLRHAAEGDDRSHIRTGCRTRADLRQEWRAPRPAVELGPSWHTPKKKGR